MGKEKTLLNATLCLLVKDNKVLLALKTQKIGKGCLNGYGGGIRKRERPRKAAVRELTEEAKVIADPEHIEKVAIIDFHNTKSDGSFFICRMHVYIVRQWWGEPEETKTMIKPTWFDIDHLPLEEMMPADRIWLQIVLKGKKIIATAKYGPFQKTLLGMELEIQENDFLPDD